MSIEDFKQNLVDRIFGATVKNIMAECWHRAMNALNLSPPLIRIKVYSVNNEILYYKIEIGMEIFVGNMTNIKFC